MTFPQWTEAINPLLQQSSRITSKPIWESATDFTLLLTVISKEFLLRDSLHFLAQATILDYWTQAYDPTNLFFQLKDIGASPSKDPRDQPVN